MSPGRLDATVVRRHLMALRRATANLARHTGRPEAALRADLDEAWIVERGLQLCAQSAIDVATHIAASAGLDAPDYASALDALATLAVVPPEFAARFRSVAGFRNVLVHAYLEIDLGRVHAILNERLKDFESFASRVEAYLAKSPG